jgi:2-oxoglutarate ferredoxin oxidoreductase subunit beta
MATWDMNTQDMAWCPGCGNFGIHTAMKKAFEELELKPESTVMVSGIGQAAKMPQYLNINMFNGLHGRSLPPATAIKAANPELTVIAESGDGCMLGEGGNHFIHTIRRNPDITIIIHNNMIYGLTKGQASPTSMKDFKTPVQTEGVILEPINHLALAISQNASFVARTFSGNQDLTVEIIKAAINHKGLSIVDIFQPCVTFNKVNTYKWYQDHTYVLENHDKTDRAAALEKAFETEKYPMGILYEIQKETFEDLTSGNLDFKEPLFKRKVNKDLLKEEFKQFA